MPLELNRGVYRIKQTLGIGANLINNAIGHRRYTYCNYLWDYATILEDGKIMTCCHGGSGTVGNIYDVSLGNVWKNSLKLKTTRWTSLNGCLSCFNGCTVLSPKEKQRFADGHVTYEEHPKYPYTVHIQLSTFCNFRCIMCPQDHNSKLVLDNEILKNNIDWSKVKRVIIQGGETLAIKSAKEFYLWLTQTMLKKVTMLTNGLLIDDQWAEYLVEGSDVVYVSVNSATFQSFKAVNNNSNFEKVIENIKKIVALKNKRRSEVLINYHFTIVPENFSEIADSIKLADEIGCDSINYSYDTTVPPFLEKNKELLKKVQIQIQDLLKQGGLGLRIEENRLDQLHLLDGVSSKNIVPSYLDAGKKNPLST